MIDYLTELGRQRRYWLFLLLSGLALEAVGLYYQYALDEWPCVLCIHVRIVVLTFVLLAVLGLVFTASTAAMRLLHGLNTLVMLVFVERSYQVLAVERGWVFGDCAMDLGMPAWFAIDEWLPGVFEVQTACGYTPLMLFDVTMAETLIVISTLMLLLSASLFATSWRD